MLSYRDMALRGNIGPSMIQPTRPVCPCCMHNMTCNMCMNKMIPAHKVTPTHFMPILGPGGEQMIPAHQLIGPGGEQMIPAHQLIGPGGEQMIPAHQLIGPGGEQMIPAHQVVPTHYDPSHSIPAHQVVPTHYDPSHSIPAHQVVPTHYDPSHSIPAHQVVPTHYDPSHSIPAHQVVPTHYDPTIGPGGENQHVPFKCLLETSREQVAAIKAIEKANKAYNKCINTAFSPVS